MRRIRLVLSVVGIVLTIAATMLAGSAAMTARHPGFRSLQPETAGVRWLAVGPAEDRGWAHVVEPYGRRW